MDLNEYQAFVQRMALSDLSDTERVLMGALGLTGEAGEVADLLKKALFHGGHAVDHLPAVTRLGLLQELGDVLWYVTFLASCFGWSLEEVMLTNQVKLEQRYPTRK